MAEDVEASWLHVRKLIPDVKPRSPQHPVILYLHSAPDSGERSAKATIVTAPRQLC